MQRVTISMGEPFAGELERFMRRRGYLNRSEALRDLARIGLDQASVEDLAADACVATLTYVGSGWRSLGDQLLANTSAAMARERRRVGRTETTSIN